MEMKHGHEALTGRFGMQNERAKGHAAWTSFITMHYFSFQFLFLFLFMFTLMFMQHAAMTCSTEKQHGDTDMHHGKASYAAFSCSMEM
jgi:hypothetical protein